MNARRRADDERKLQARGLAVAIYPEILEIGASLDGTRGAWARAGARVLGPGSAAVFEAFKITSPPNLATSVDRLHLLGSPAGTTLIQLASVISQYNRMLDAMKARVASNHEEDLVMAQNAAAGHLNAIDRLVFQAREQVTPIHDGVANH